MQHKSHIDYLVSNSFLRGEMSANNRPVDVVSLYLILLMTCVYNNNIYLPHLGGHPVGVVILHVKKHMKLVTTKFKLGGPHEKHLVATWNLGNHLSVCL